jgi:hypothetical protein
MAKKDKKKKGKKGSDAADAVAAVRSAVERTFQATTEGAEGTQKRTRALADEVANAASRIRETIEELRILEDVKGLRREIESLAGRVRALEIRDARPSRPAPAKTAAKRTAKRTAKRAASKPAQSAKPSSTAKRSTSAKRAAAKRSPAKRSASAKRGAAKRAAKPAKRAAS